MTPADIERILAVLARRNSIPELVSAVDELLDEIVAETPTPRMKSYWDLTEAEQAKRLKLIDEPLTLGGVQEAFRHPASYGELRISATAIALYGKLHKATTDRDAAVVDAVSTERAKLAIATEALETAQHYTQHYDPGEDGYVARETCGAALAKLRSGQ